MKKLFTLFLLCLASIGYTQITITSDDMPSVNDTIRTSLAYNTDIYDFSLTGENFNWDFSELEPISQNVESFVSVSDMPFTLYLFFMTSANLTRPFMLSEMIQGVPEMSAYQFLNNNSNRYADVGYGISYEGMAIPLSYNHEDVIYQFPMTFGQEFSSVSGMETGIPNIGYIMIDRNRQNQVDGWGTITTPFGSFEVLRYRSDVQEVDSVYINSISIGQQIDRNYTEYQWIAKDKGLPILKATQEEGLPAVVTYLDSARVISVGMNEQIVNQNLLIFPNPTKDLIQIQLDDETTTGIVSIFDLSGQLVFEKNYSNNHTIKLNLKNSGLHSGVYFISILTNNKAYRSKIILN